MLALVGEDTFVVRAVTTPTVPPTDAATVTTATAMATLVATAKPGAASAAAETVVELVAATLAAFCDAVMAMLRTVLSNLCHKKNAHAHTKESRQKGSSGARRTCQPAS